MLRQYVLAFLRAAKKNPHGVPSGREVASLACNKRLCTTEHMSIRQMLKGEIDIQQRAHLARGRKLPEVDKVVGDANTAEDGLNACDRSMQHSLDYLQKALRGMQTGRASAGMLDIISIEAYDSRVPLKGIASVSVRDRNTLAVSVYDANVIKAVEKGIRLSSLGLNPVIQDKEIIVNIPRLTKESVMAMQKLVKKEGESAKTSIRSARKEVLGSLKKLASEDERKRLEKHVQALTDRHIKEVDQIVSSKEAELSSAI